MRRAVLWVFLCTLFLSFFNILRIDNKISNIEKEIDKNTIVNITGEIKDIYYKNENYQVVCKSNKIRQNSNIYNNSLKFIIYTPNIEELEIGDKIDLNSNITFFSKPTNPGGINMKNYYFAKKIYFSVYTKDILLVDKGKFNFFKLIRSINKRIEDQIYRLFPKNEGDIISTLLLGSKDNLSENLKELYKVAGISHLLAISGLHISIIGMGTFVSLRKLTYNQKLSSTFAIIISFFYVFLSGSSVSSLRALIMFLVMQLSLYLNENYDSLSALLFSGSIILITNPYQILDVGFLLSFSSVLGIITITRFLNTKLNKKFNPIKNLLFISIGANVLTLPIILWFFYELPLYSLISNLIIIPSLSIIMVFSILSVLLSFLFFPLGKILGGIGFFLLNYIEFVSKIISHLPLNQIVLGRPRLIFIIIYYVLVFFIIYGKKTKSLTKLNISIAYIIIILTIKCFNINDLSIYLLDVGQGDCTVIEYHNKVFLIDGGGEIFKKSDKNTGTYVIMPYLASRGINKIDGIFISHSDFDHIYGIIETIQKTETKFIVLPKPYETYKDELTKNLLEIAKDKAIKIYYFNEGSDYAYLDLKIDCIYPFKNHYLTKNNNSNSLVLKLSYKDFSMLFTGDIEKESEEAISRKYNDKINIIKVPHHGSNTSSTEEFLESFKPKQAIFSYGNKNSFGHPSDSVVKRYADKEINSYHIGKEGAVNIKIKKDKFFITTYLSKRKDKLLCRN